MRTVRINIQESYMPSLNAFLETLPKEAVETQKSLDNEIKSRLNEYKNGTMKTTLLRGGLDRIRAKIEAKIEKNFLQEK